MANFTVSTRRPITPADDDSNSAQVATVARGQAWDENTSEWRRHPRGTLPASSVIASGTRTATVSSALLVTPPPYRGVGLIFVATSRPGTASTINLGLRSARDAGAGATDAWVGNDIAHNAASATTMMIFHPDAPSGGTWTGLAGYATAYPVLLPPQFVVHAFHNNSESWTYSVQAFFVP